MKRFALSCLFLMLAAPSLRSQTTKLVVLISLDQFPYDYIERFEPYFGKKGFRYLLAHGANFPAARYDHASTKTAAGHAVIATGSYARRNGIPGNRWWDREKRKSVSSVDDAAVQTLGTGSPGHSPRNLLTYTAGDMLELGTNGRSKVVSIAHKDRSAILMGGKLGKAFWFDDSVVVSSTYYMKDLPGWLSRFNASGAMKRYFGATWGELNPSAAAVVCDRDDAWYEQNIYRIGKTFPHTIAGDSPAGITPSYYRALAYSPFASELLFDVVRKECIADTLGGRRGATDLLCVGVSITDDIGHVFGPESHEVFDNALRLDSMLAGFFGFLDGRVGLKNCLIVLTSDHGIPPIPEYVKEHTPGSDAGRISSGSIRKLVSATLDSLYGPLSSAGAGGGGGEWIEDVVESDVYLSRSALAAKGATPDAAAELLKKALAYRTPFAGAYTRAELERGGSSPGDRMKEQFERSYSGLRSGDIIFVLKPYYIMSGETTGTNHGQPYDYDSHVPLMLAGPGVRPGTYEDEASPADIAPTISALLKIEFPPSREGRVLKEILR